MGDTAPRSEPLGSRQTDANGNAVEGGWKYDRHSTAMKKINTAQVPQEPLGDQDRGRKA